MDINISNETADRINTGLLVAGMFEKDMNEAIKGLDRHLKGAISSMISEGRFRGEWGETETIDTLGCMGAGRILLVGLGKKEEFTLEKLRKAAGISAKAARDSGIKKYATSLQNVLTKESVQDRCQAVAEATLMALYAFDKYKTDRSKIKTADSLSLVIEEGRDEARKGLERGIVYAEAANLARDVVNTPANIMTPQAFADEARKTSKECGLRITVMGKKELEKAGMNAIVAVSEGSDKEPQLAIMEYFPEAEEKVALVGKGITFDTGGVDLKPWDSMESMKSDKAGAAAVLGALKACAQLKPGTGVIGVMVLAENMVGEKAMKPGDIIKAYNGKTVEIMNTDAEGRLVLADAISYVEKNYKPSAIIDIGTLTGSCIIALGYHASGLISTDDKLAKRLAEAGEKSHERVWQLPFWEEYQEVYKSDNADVRNVAKEKYGPGAISGAVFIKQFVEKTPWAHLDIAGPAWLSSGRDYIPAGGTGWGVRLMAQLIEDWQAPDNGPRATSNP
ncbi:MAG: leucyl aminopeptidase [Candidatus Aenigmarchaeota archaeon]|nr:leucyl aminopeptidase [Candidatus Aenigmarchaeota archaeon]